MSVCKNRIVALSLLTAIFIFITMPVAFKPPTGGRSGERQGQTAGIIRMYCEDSSKFFFKGPQIHFGNRPFNMEVTVFEWLEGHIARVIDDPGCDSVEVVAKTISVLFSALGVFIIGLLGFFLWGSHAGLTAASLLAFNDLWLRYASYAMIENRVITCALLAMLFCFKRRFLLGSFFWFLTLIQKPTVFAFCVPFWLCLEFFKIYEEVGSISKVFKYSFRERDARNTILSFMGAMLLGVVSLKLSYLIDQQSDLPWVQWTGPRHQSWYFGNWQERLQWTYWKNLFLDSARRSGFLVVAPCLIFLGVAGSRLQSRKGSSQFYFQWQFLLSIFCSFLIARFVYTFCFYNVYIVHEYYALPLNMGMALATAASVSALFGFVGRKKPLLPVLCLVAVLASNCGAGILDYWRFLQEIKHSNSSLYFKDYDIQVFPKKHVLVAMVVQGSGRDLLHLYLSKQHGFVWCIDNPKYAPRAFWKKSGVEYVAWQNGRSSDGKTKWLVRTIDEELAYARSQHWSSDVWDAWQGKTMEEWAALGSRTGKDPCKVGGYDPREW